MSKLLYVAEDFNLLFPRWNNSIKAAEVANVKLKAWLDEAPTAYCYQNLIHKWVCIEDDGVAVTTHIGKLVNLEELK